jgi:hypothetical protein
MGDRRGAWRAKSLYSIAGSMSSAAKVTVASNYLVGDVTTEVLLQLLVVPPEGHGEHTHSDTQHPPGPPGDRVKPDSLGTDEEQRAPRRASRARVCGEIMSLS